MWGVRVVMVVAVASILSGCASGRTRQDMARLQSQVGMLDERVTQLERSSFSGSPSAALGETSLDAGSSLGQMVAPVKNVSIGTQASAPSSAVKPATHEVQQALKNAGFYQGPVDGKMGALTKEAIKEFQRVHGLKDDGVAGRQTWAKLRAYANLSSGSPEGTAVVLK